MSNGIYVVVEQRSGSERRSGTDRRSYQTERRFERRCICSAAGQRH